LAVRRPFIFNLAVGLILPLVLGLAKPAPASAGTVHHYEYVFTAGFIYVYDMDNGFKLLKTVQVPTGAGMRGGVASAATGMLYLSYGSDGNSGGFQLAYDLATDKVAWTMSYSHGIDSQSVTPDGKKIYMPEGELSSGGTWYVEDTANGNDLTTIATPGHGPHNTIVSPNGTRVYMGDRDFTSSAGTNDFNIADTATNQIVGGISPLKSGARPFTINSAETFSFNTVTGFMGFQVGDIATGKVIYTVTVNGSNIPGFTTQTPATIPSHGISLSPDGREIYLIDQPNGYVHVFDVTGLPGSAPVQVADIKLVNAISGNEVGCAYDCLKDGWVHHSRDGRFVFVGDSGDVVDTLTRKTIATLPQMGNSRQEIEIDFQDSTPIWASTSRAAIGYVNPLPPNFTARITSPALGSTVSGSNLSVTTSVFDSVAISSVDLYKDAVLFASTTTSPYSFTWDTTKDANGPHDLKITANDSSGNSTSFVATFTVNNVNTPTPPSITTASLSGGTQNAAYSATLAATGGTAPYSWSISSGTLPAGLTLASTTGVIAGTPAGTGSSNFTVKVTDTNTLTATKSLSIAVAVAPSSPSISTASLLGGTQNAIYSATLAAIGGTAPYTWSVSSGTLPTGLTLASATGLIAGTPTGTGSSTFTVKVTDANTLTATKSLSIAVAAAPSSPSITTASLPAGTQNSAYSNTLAATGGTTPYSWSIASGTLPTGLALASTTGVISGTSTGTGTSTFLVKVTDAHALTATKSLSITVNAAPTTPSPLSIVTSSLSAGTHNTPYSDALTATGGTTPYSWSIISGTLPTGLALTSATGAVSGTPTGSGTSTFTVKVTDAHALTATKSFSVTVSAPSSVSSMTATGGAPQSTWTGTAFTSTLKVTVKDSAGNPLPGIVVTFTAPAQTGPSGTFAGGANTATTNASGVATSAAFAANQIAGGPYNVTASVMGASATATFSLTNIDFTIDDAGPGIVQVTPGTPSSVALGLVTTPQGSKLPSDVILSCTAKLPQANATCTLSPTKIPAGSPSGSVTMLMINTTAQLPPSSQRQGPSNPRLPWAIASALAGLLAIFFSTQHKIAPLRGRMAYLTLALLAISTTGLVGCTGLTSASQNGPSGVTVTATSQGISKTATISIKLK
jgi:Bacterial Ig domain/Putative Ig domain